MHTRLCTQISHHLNRHVGPTIQPGLPVKHTQKDRERRGADVFFGCRGKQRTAAGRDLPRASSGRQRRWMGWPASWLNDASACACGMDRSGPWPPDHVCGRLQPRPTAAGEHRRRWAKEKGNVSTSGSMRIRGTTRLSSR
jgi:hypothetical protein